MLQDIKILVVGDVMYDAFDNYHSASRKELKSEFPGRFAYVNAEQTEALGGAGNVVANLASLGVRTALAGVIGSDDAGERIITLCEEQAIHHLLLRSFERVTTCKERIYIDGHFQFRRDREDAAPLSGSLAMNLLQAARRQLPECRALVLSDYSKGIFQSSVGVGEQLIREAALYQIPVIVDCKPANVQRFAGATVLAQNELEAKGLFPKFAEDRKTGVLKIRELVGVDYYVVTLNQDGMIFTDGSFVKTIKAEPVQVKNPVGAGDTVRAFIALGLSLGYPIEETLTLANRAAGRVIQKEATAILELAEVQDLLRSLATPSESPAEQQKELPSYCESQ